MSDLVRDSIAASLATIEQIATTPAAIGYGRDLLCINDLDPRAKETDPLSLETLSQDCYHRVATSRGQMPDDDDYGLDLAEFLHRPTTQADLLAMAGAVTAEMRKDDRISNAVTTVTSDLSSLTVTIEITPKDPDLQIFTLIVSVTDGETLLKETLL